MHVYRALQTLRPNESLPVMVYYPAGGYAYGAGDDTESNGLPQLEDIDVMLVLAFYLPLCFINFVMLS